LGVGLFGYRSVMRHVVVRLRPGADLKRELLDLAGRERVAAGWVVTCVGSLSEVRLRLAGAAEHDQRRMSYEASFILSRKVLPQAARS
jgi:predicted DNA-binding protein with PD1-like motif